MDDEAYQKKIKLIKEVLNEFPAHVARKQQRAIDRKAFLEATFGELVRELQRRRALYAKRESEDK